MSGSGTKYSNLWPRPVCCGVCSWPRQTRSCTRTFLWLSLSAGNRRSQRQSSTQSTRSLTNWRWNDVRSNRKSRRKTVSRSRSCLLYSLKHINVLSVWLRRAALMSSLLYFICLCLSLSLSLSVLQSLNVEVFRAYLINVHEKLCCCTMIISPVRLSVCLSITRMHQSKTVEVRITKFLPLW